MRHFSIVFLLILLGCAPKDDRSVEVQPSRISVPSNVQSAADTYRDLRPIAGQFSGGSWQNEVDDWHGAKHIAMINVAAFADDNKIEESLLIELLGEPDLVVQENDKLLNLIKLQPDYQDIGSDTSDHLIYHWRGEHDFLYFESERGKIVQSGWWYSME